MINFAEIVKIIKESGIEVVFEKDTGVIIPCLENLVIYRDKMQPCTMQVLKERISKEGISKIDFLKFWGRGEGDE